MWHFTRLRECHPGIFLEVLIRMTKFLQTEEARRGRKQKKQWIPPDWAETLGWTGRTIYFSTGTIANTCYGPTIRARRLRSLETRSA